MSVEQGKVNSEEAYFYKVNKELLDRKRAELDAVKKKESAEARSPHWMKCPKCGQNMEEIEIMKIQVDKCQSCKGIFFDHGELQSLLDSQEPKGFLGVLRKVF